MHSPWRLDQRRATLELGPFKATVDLDQPELGLHQLTLAGIPIAPAQILGVELPTSEPGQDRFVEAYLRGNDLIATYAQVATPSLRWQIYWRACPHRFPSALAAIEAIVSVQTGLLESQPSLSTRTQLPATGTICWRSTREGSLNCEQFESSDSLPTLTAAQGWGCFGFELPGAVASYVEMVHPADFGASAVEPPTNGVTLRHRLFCDSLEKGVILRSRVLGLLLPHRPTVGAIADFRQALADEELPLTT